MASLGWLQESDTFQRRTNSENVSSEGAGPGEDPVVEPEPRQSGSLLLFSFGLACTSEIVLGRQGDSYTGLAADL